MTVVYLVRDEQPALRTLITAGSSWFDQSEPISRSHGHLSSDILPQKWSTKSRSMMYQFWKTVSLPSSSSRRDLSHYSKKVVKLVHNSYEWRQALWIWWKKGLIHLLCSSSILRLFFCDLTRSSVSDRRAGLGRADGWKISTDRLMGNWSIGTTLT